MSIVSNDEYSFSDEDIEEIRKASEDPLFFDKLVMSIAPALSGIDDIKRALALQLFGSVRRILDDGTVFPGNINILLLTDTSEVTDEIMRSMSILSPISIVLNGNGSDGLYLTGRSSGNCTGNDQPAIVPGAVTLANNGLVCVKDIDNLPIEDEAALFDAVHYLKNVLVSGNNVVTLPADVSLLCTAVSKGDSAGTLIDRFGLHKSVICKFEPIFILSDGRKFADMDDFDSKKNCQVKAYSEEFIRKYVAYSRLNSKPEWSEENITAIQAHYVAHKNETGYMGSKHFETLLRLAEASARSRLSDTVDLSDIKRSFEVFDYYLMNLKKTIWGEDGTDDANDGRDEE